MTTTSTTIPTLLVDTSAWVALASPRDEFHDDAVRFYEALPARSRLLTTNLILAETHAFLLRRRGAEEALRFCAAIRDSGRTRVHRVSTEEEEKAWRLLSRRGDWGLSFVDATSFAYLGESHSQVFTFDRHFAAGGFQVLPRS